MKLPEIILTVALVCNTTLHAFTLDTVITRSDSCVAIEWTPDSSNTANLWYTQYGNKCTGSDTIYRQCDFIAGRTYRGIAYSYGGEDPWFTFRTRLAAGFLAGSHQCHYNVFGDPSGKVYRYRLLRFSMLCLEYRPDEHNKSLQ